MHECNVANTFIQESPRRESSPWYDDAQAKHHRVRASYILLVVRGVIRHSRDLWSILLEPPGRLIIEQNCALQSYCVFFKLPCFTTREVWGKVMFSQVFVCPQGVCLRGVYIQGD